MIRRRTLFRSALTSGAALGLAACGAKGSKGSGSSSASASSSAASVIKKVQVTGDVGAKPAITFPAPLTIAASESSVLVTGDGKKIVAGDEVGMHTVYVNAKDGSVLQSSWEGGPGSYLYMNKDSIGPEALKAFTSATIGSRILMLGQVQDSSGQTLSVVQVSDIVSTALKRAQGAAQPIPADQVQFTLGKDGAPALKGKPTMAAPAQTVATVSIQGDGEQTAAGDTLAMHYTGWKLSDGSQFDSSWKKGEPFSFTLGAQQVITGWDKALTGQKVGSQLLLVIPPAEAYGDKGASDGGSSSTGLEGETLVFVVDILGAIKPPAS